MSDIYAEEKDLKWIHHYSAYVLIVYFTLFPFEYILSEFGIGSILKYIGILAMVMAVLDVFVFQNHRIRIDYRWIIPLIWVTYVAISGIWAANKELYSRYMQMYVNNCLMLLVVSFVNYTEREYKFIKRAYITGVAALFVYMTFYPGAVVYSTWQHRLTLASRSGQELIDQNYLSAIIIMPFGIILYKLVSGELNKKNKVLAIAFIAASIIYILLTGSRSGLVSAGVIAVLVFAKIFKRRAAVVILILLIIVLLLPRLISNLDLTTLQRFTLNAITGRTAESDDRIMIWSIALDSLKQGGLLIGRGAGASENIIGLSYERMAGVHNFYLSHVLELGLIGFSVFITLIIKMMKQIRNSEEIDLYLAFIGMLTMCFFLDTLTTKFFWCSLLIMSICISSRKGCMSIIHR